MVAKMHSLPPLWGVVQWASVTASAAGHSKASTLQVLVWGTSSSTAAPCQCRVRSHDHHDACNPDRVLLRFTDSTTVQHGFGQAGKLGINTFEAGNLNHSPNACLWAKH